MNTQNTQPELNRVYPGDGAHLMNTLLEPNSVDLIVTSCPYDDMRDYGNETRFDFVPMIEAAHRVLKTGGVMVWNTRDQIRKGNQSLTSMKQAIYMQMVGFSVIIEYAQKTNPQTNQKLYAHTPAIELLIIATKGGYPKTFNPRREKCTYAGQRTNGSNGRLNGYQPTSSRIIQDTKKASNVWVYTAGGGKKGHPAKMDDHLCSEIIKTYSDRGDLILDPMAGSGTTAVCAEKLERNWLAFELNQDYIKRFFMPRIERLRKQPVLPIVAGVF